ncbi:MAG: helix-turn-helix transcriptional regulator [bacterium]|nr:helix-turn-helix transcriptional regulator [bacterium]
MKLIEDINSGFEINKERIGNRGFQSSTRILIMWGRMKGNLYQRRRLRETMPREMMPQPTDIVSPSIGEQFMEELKQVMETHFSQMEFGVDQLARALYISRATLNRKIKALTGKSTNQFIKYYRLRRAAQLLEANAGNVTEVAFQVGFSDSSYFTRCFKETFRQLPNSFRAPQSRPDNWN